MTRNPAILKDVKPYNVERDRVFSAEPKIAEFLLPLDRPAFVAGSQAGHMRDDDYVIGLAYEGEARAYPVWILDYYHSVNDWIGDTPVAFFT